MRPVEGHRLIVRRWPSLVCTGRIKRKLSCSETPNNCSWPSSSASRKKAWRI
nr:MAG TPA: hypothetical protein [Caudoviricetes sp.]